MPKEPVCTFKNTQKMLKRPYVTYADFECITSMIDTCSNDAASSYTNNYQRHEPLCYGLIGILDCGHKRQIEAPETYRGTEPVTHFITKILEKADKYQKIRQHYCYRENKIDCSQATHCHICGELLKPEDAVTDHCHLCGVNRGLAHSQCNLKYSLDKDIVVGFHNLRRYDGHLIMLKIGKECINKGLSLEYIPKGMENYLSFTIVTPEKYRIKFIDTLQFLPKSLEQLAHITEKTPILETQYAGKELKLMKQKGIYPYDYVDCLDRLDGTALLPKEAFTNLLSGEEITADDYERAETVWELMNVKTLGGYTDLYLLTDVLLLADIFENFRNFSLKNYSLDPTHYYTLPSLSWDACLKYTGIELELLTDPDMYIFMEDGIRGGISTIIHRYAKANNPYLNDYDVQKDISYIMYLDMNIQLLFTDTDSLCYLVKTQDIYKDMLQEIHLYDTSDYPKDARGLHSEKNKKRLGVIKDETNGKPISEFVGLRSKMYSLKTEDEEKKRVKGIVKKVVKKNVDMPTTYTSSTPRLRRNT